MRTTAESPYPAHWEADVVLRDGGTAHIRPITPDDAERLVRFFERVSAESKYHRFFAPYPRLSDRDVHRFTHHDYVDRVGLAATVGGDFLATVRYDRIDAGGRAATAPADHAEVAFLVQDAHQGRGIASTLLEHIAAVARERGIRRFVAEVLPANARMIKVFTDAGYAQRRSFADGTVHLTLDLEPTAESLAVMRAREQRAEARSVERLLAPRSVAVIGASREEGGVGRAVLAALLECGFNGPVHAVNSALPPGRATLGGAPAHRSLPEIGQPVDLAVLAVPAPRVGPLLAECAAQGVTGLVVLTTGHTRDEQRDLVRRARSLGMRIVGPGAFGLINTAPTIRLNASPAPRMPRRGPVGLFTQSAAIGIALLDELERCGAGLSTFVSAGNRADVSGNDVLQFWFDDPDTRVVLMYLESLGNPRKFTRLARRAAAAGKPVVVVRGGRHSGGAPPHGHAVPPGGRTPEPTISALLAQAGVIEADTATELVDAALLLAHQPLPDGPRVAVIGNAEALALVAHDACRAQGLDALPVTALGPGAGPEEYGRALADALADPRVDAAVVTAVPGQGPGGAPGAGGLAQALHAAAAGKPLAVAHLALDGLAEELAARGIPAFPSAERAARALAHAARHAHWLARSTEPGRVPAYADIDESAARRVIEEAMPERSAADLTPGQVRALLAAYGVPVEPGPAESGGVDTVVRAEVDPAIGAVLSFGLAGPPSELLGDIAHRLLPLTDRDAAELVRSVRAAPMLFGWRGARPVDTGRLEELLLRLGRLVEDQPGLAAVELSPLTVAPSGACVRAASARVAPPPRTDPGPRRLPAY
ncbi:GNAT family N-acetyltransferase [Streptomyces sp. 6N223]|uniref:GNAT family N-acetyltransferase n=1 Tax=Streptomyces sp. 6N223 TaxID=3457412 RepID=UPI003FD13BAF